jgi:hypothetical protein
MNWAGTITFAVRLELLKKKEEEDGSDDASKQIYFGCIWLWNLEAAKSSTSINNVTLRATTISGFSICDSFSHDSLARLYALSILHK